MKQLVFGVLCCTAALFFSACNKNDNNITPPVVPALFSIVVDNQFNLLQGQYAAYLTDTEGKVLSFRWLDGTDTTQLQVPASTEQDQYDCTIVKMTILQTVVGRDTSVELTTYHQVKHNSTINLRNNDFQIVTNLQVQFTNITSVDTIIVPDGLTFLRPLPSNNYFGMYRVVHTGNMWFRLKINGESHWRYMYFADVSSPTLSAAIDATLLPVIFDEPKSVDLPFLTTWKYNIQGINSIDQRRFLPLGDLERAPGGAVPVLNQLSIFEPLQSGFAGYRVNVSGTADPAAEGYTYFCDRIYDQLPTALEIPDFDLAPTILGDSRLVAVQCSGSCDAILISRQNTGHPHLSWRALAPSIGNGTFVHRLPDVPKELWKTFPKLKAYDFGGIARVRAERYDLLNGFEAVQSKWMENSDPLWQARSGYLAREEAF